MIKFNSLQDEIDFFSPSEELRVKVESFLDEKVIIIDNFYRHPEKVRELALSIPSTRSPGILHGLPGSRVEATYHFAHLGYMFNEIIRRVFSEDVINIPDDFIYACINRASFLVNVQNSNVPPRVPHIDNPSGGRWAAGIYLNTPEECAGGTAFYTYKGSKTITLERASAELQHVDYYVQDDTADFKKIFLAEMKFNRFVLYRQNVLHTPYIPPNTFTDENPRLIQMFFI